MVGNSLKHFSDSLIFHELSLEFHSFVEFLGKLGSEVSSDYRSQVIYVYVCETFVHKHLSPVN